jgi:hypothetical protein
MFSGSLGAQLQSIMLPNQHSFWVAPTHNSPMNMGLIRTLVAGMVQSVDNGQKKDFHAQLGCATHLNTFA